MGRAGVGKGALLAGEACCAMQGERGVGRQWQAANSLLAWSKFYDQMGLDVKGEAHRLPFVLV